MTVSSTTLKNSYTASGSQTTFAYAFKIFADADLKVYVNGTLKTLTTHYTVTNAGVTAGGNVVFGTGLTASDKVVIQRDLTLTQATDYVENDPFPADSHETALDRLTFIVQQLNDGVESRSFKFAKTVTDAGTIEINLDSSDRSSKILAFDSTGGLSATQEIGVFQGNWAASTSYVLRDIIKDTNNNNIYICITAHTSSGSVPISSNTDSAKWSLLVDAASATTSATAAATSATASATSATASATSATASATSATASASSASTASTQASNASTSATAAAASYDSFDDRYLGSKSSNPSTDNDGNALATGALYWNSSTDSMFSYTGSTWVAIKPTSSEQTDISALAASAVVADMALLATTDCIADMALLATSDIISDMNTLATSDIVSDINTLATSDIVSDLNTLATSDIVTDINVLATSDIVSDLNTLATSDIVTDINLLATSDIVSDLNTLATSDIVSDLNTLATSDVVADLSTVADNIAGVNSFADRYRVGSSDPSSSLDEGDLAFNTTSNAFKYYSGSAWVAVTAPDVTLADATALAIALG
jgi:hypothetical protein